MALHPASAYSLWKAAERPVPNFSNPFFCLTHSSPCHHQSLKSTSISRLNRTLFGNTSSYRTPIAMGIQMEEAVMADRTPTVEDIVNVVEFTVPPESLVGFYADYEKVSATWPEDLATTVDDIKIDQFVSSAHALVRRWLPAEVVSRVEKFVHDPEDPPALVIRGLPIDKDLPPTEPNAHIKKTGKCVSETWLAGIARIVGQPFTVSSLRGSRTGMGLLVRELYTTAEKVDQASAEGSRVRLDFHLDYFQVREEFFPHVIVFIGLRGDVTKEGKTLLCNNRKLYRTLDPADIQVLRTQEITWTFGSFGGFSRHVIEGTESNPRFNLFEENLPSMGGFDKLVRGSPEAVAAYRRVKDLAASTYDGVWLDGGDVLVLNQKKASHGRSSYHANYDGNDRWMQKTYSNRGGFWDNGLLQWPNRTIPFS